MYCNADSQELLAFFRCDNDSTAEGQPHVKLTHVKPTHV